MGRILPFIAVVAGGALIGSAYAVIRGGGEPGGAGAQTRGPQPAPAAGPPRIVLGERPAVRLDVGAVARGGRREVPFVVSNPGPAAVTVGAVRTSCDCLRVELDATRVEAGTEVGGRAVIDLAGEPGFAGGLMLDAEAAEDGRPVFALKLSLQAK